MSWPMNQWRLMADVEGKEVGEAYNMLVEKALYANGKRPGGVRFILFREDDNLPNNDCLKRVIDAIYTCIDCGATIDEDRYKKSKEWFCVNGHKGLDAVSGLYFAKDDPPIPFVFGDPAIEHDMTQLNIVDAIKEGRVVECNGVPQGFLIARLDMFNKLSRPWFKTLAGVNNQFSLTQDLYFCKKAKEELGARFAVDCGAHVGHIDTTTGRIY